MTLGGALEAAAGRLARAGVLESRLDAELLLGHVLGVRRGSLAGRRGEGLGPAALARFEALLARRERREPCQHILATQEFHGLEFACDRRALVPRPETEGLVDVALGRGLPAEAHVADLGTGSGCIAVTLAVRRPGIEVHALDSSPAALALAEENARRHGVHERIELRRGDLARPPAEWRGRMALVVSNPPYVAAAEWADLAPEVRDFDPQEALVAGPTGLEAHAALTCSAAALLPPGGSLIAEIGFGQAAAVRAMYAAAGWAEIEIRPDLRGIPRVLVARRPEPR